MNLTWQSTDNAWIVRLDGRLDITASDDLESRLKEKLKEDPRNLVLNLSRVTYMSSSGIGALLAVYRFNADRDKQVALCEVSTPITKLFDVVEIRQIFQIYDNEQDAVKALSE